MLARVVGLFSSREFLLFLLVGGVAAAANFFSRILFNYMVDFSVAIVLAYLVGMVVAFALNKLFVFESTSHGTPRQVVYFCLVNLAAVLQTWVVSMAIYHYILPLAGVDVYSREIAHSIGILVPVFTSYVGHKYFTFK